MHILCFAVYLIIDQDVSSWSDRKLSSCSLKAVWKHSIVALQTNIQWEAGHFQWKYKSVEKNWLAVHRYGVYFFWWCVLICLSYTPTE